MCKLCDEKKFKKMSEHFRYCYNLTDYNMIQENISRSEDCETLNIVLNSKTKKYAICSLNEGTAIFPLSFCIKCGKSLEREQIKEAKQNRER